MASFSNEVDKHTWGHIENAGVHAVSMTVTLTAYNEHKGEWQNGVMQVQALIESEQKSLFDTPVILTPGVLFGALQAAV